MVGRVGEGCDGWRVDHRRHSRRETGKCQSRESVAIKKMSTSFYVLHTAKKDEDFPWFLFLKSVYLLGRRG